MPEEMTPEQVAALQEKIKNMSPEELKEFQKKQCIFCQIVSGKIQSKKIFEDDKVIAILDINPANPGHLLVLPKEHYTIMPQIPKEELGHLFIIIKYLSNALLKSFEAKGTNILVANGIAAGQKAQHFMAHVIPRKTEDSLNFELPQRKLSEQEVEIIREKLAKRIAEILEKKPPAKKEPKPKAIREQKVVEAEIKEEKKELIEEKEPEKKIIPEKEPKKKKAVKKEKTEESKEKTEGIDLDQIARLLNIK